MAEDRSTAAEIRDLMRDMPSTWAAPDVRAAWFRRKAALYDRIAEETDVPRIAQESRQAAETARRMVNELTGGE